MKILKLFCLIIGLGTLQLNAQNSAQQTVDAFFEALNTKNTEKIKSLCVDDLVLSSISVRGASSNMTQQTLQSFLSSLKAMPETMSIKEEITKSKSRDSDYLAQFWLDYEFYINNKLSHQGVNAITLVKSKDGWKISAISDTRIKEEK